MLKIEAFLLLQNVSNQKKNHIIVKQNIYLWLRLESKTIK
jgi:hypothetical protein